MGIIILLLALAALGVGIYFLVIGAPLIGGILVGVGGVILLANIIFWIKEHL